MEESWEVGLYSDNNGWLKNIFGYPEGMKKSIWAAQYIYSALKDQTENLLIFWEQKFPRAPWSQRQTVMHVFLQKCENQVLQVKQLFKIKYFKCTERDCYFKEFF